jgi:putative CocE/NonD family hydrolase
LLVRTEFPFRVRVIRHEWIPVPDGCRLAARIWLPEDAGREPVPAVFEYVPYRKNDGLVLRDAPIHHYFAGHGYASVRVDMRGTGDSDGILEDEYLPLEQEDGVAVIRWLAAQPWCTGKVGIIGESWGGFNGLQIAALHPPGLAAVISVASTDDRYADDVHYMGGCLLAWTALPWASTMLAYNALPPDPAVVGDAWRRTWQERLEETPPYIEAWLAHQRRDEFWRQGSVCEDYAAIHCPVYMVGGWTDAYRNAILRFLAGYPGPCKGLIGPWAHDYPEDGAPGPAIGFLQEAVRWWDRWLKGQDNGIMNEPKLRAWIPEARRPAPGYTEFPGRWLAAGNWPAPQVRTRVFRLGPGPASTGTLSPGGDVAGPHGARASEVELRIRRTDAPAGDLGQWGGHGGPTEFPGDQRPEDGMSLTFDTSPLTEPVEMLGFPVARLELAVDRPLALVAVRLCDVWPDGASTLITRGLKNLTHRDSDEHPEPLVPGERYTFDITLNSIGYQVPAGHRLRLAVSPTYWPWAWPSPEPVTLSLFSGGSTVRLPMWTEPGEHTPPAHFAGPERAPMPPHEPLGGGSGREVRRDVATGTVEVTSTGDAGHRLLDDGLEYREQERDAFRITDGDPLSAIVRSDRTFSVGRGEWQTTVAVTSTMSATTGAFLVTNVLDAYEGDRRVFAKTWHIEVPRDFV